MKVLLIHQVGGPRGSGAVLSTYRLHKSLLARGVESTLACQKALAEEDEIVTLPRSDRIESVLKRFTWRLGLREIHCVSTFKLPKFKPFLEADVVSIHGFHTGFFNYLALPRLARHKPIVATLRDMWNFTGHCAYTMGCERWRTGCGKCPNLQQFPPIPRDGTAIEWKLKNWAYRHSDLVVVTPSQWLAGLARESMLGRFEVHCIPNAVDTNTYHPRDRETMRRLMGIPPGKHALLFSAVSISNHIKGGELLLQALEHLPERLRETTVLVLMGQNGAEFAARSVVPVIDLGYLGEPDRKAEAYAAADLVLLPSRQENLSNVLLESLASGTPAVAFDIGGNGDVVRPGETGFLAAEEDTADYARGIAQLLDDEPLRARLGENCVGLAEREFSLEQEASRYIELFEQVCGAWSSKVRRAG